MSQQAQFLTARQAAERLTAGGMAVTKETVQRWCREDRLTNTATLGGHYRIPAAAVDALLQTGPPIDAGVA